LHSGYKFNHRDRSERRIFSPNFSLGQIVSDTNGDRLNGDFDFWTVRLRNGSYKWVRVGTYNNGILTVF
jgi:hypothetical protein